VSKKSKDRSRPANGDGDRADTAAGAPRPPAPITEGDAELARKLEELTPEQAEMFVRALHLAMRKRRVLLVGYLATAISLVLGWLWALYIFGKTSGSGDFMAWVFLIPPAIAAIMLVLFGRISRGLRD
jgi:hypothetical protein